MKKLYSIAIVLVCMMIVFQSCSKQSAKEMIPAVSPNVINATIAPNQAYTFSANTSGDLSIEKQASHFQISSVETDEKNGQIVYQYVPARDYTGKDEVILGSKVTTYSSDNRSECSSNHTSNEPVSVSYTTKYTTIRFTINN